ncbi:MAG: fucose permease [Chthoniobacteraceae bacterium]|nr:fucose permease [Chthoniobacteraceae bacterium]
MNPTSSPHARRLFLGCFIALVTCAFGFIVRTQVIGEWQSQFNLDETQKGDILGVGFWPFAFSIFLFSFIIDKVGYGRVAAFGFFCHIVSTFLLVTATSARQLYWGTFIFALSNGTVESYINGAVATMFPNEKTKWLNILHAGWPGGMVLAGMLGIAMGNLSWQWKVGLTFVPTLVYGCILLGQHFPVSERVAAGVSYREMLADFGALGAFVATYFIGVQVCEGILHMSAGQFIWPLLPALAVAAIFGIAVGSIGQPIYFALLLIMLPLATTELGVDSWIGDLMAPEMRLIGLHAGWVLVYTSLIMTVLRCFAGPLIHKLSPIGLLASCSLLAALGLFSLSKAAGVTILLAATLYGVGKSFFWPTMLGLVAERFPRGGAVALNCIGGVGMLGLSVGMVFLGNIQDKHAATTLVANQPQLADTYLGTEKTSVFGRYRALDLTKMAAAPEGDKAEIDRVRAVAKKKALSAAAVFPAIMLVCYIGLILHFRARGGYRRERLKTPDPVSV